MGFKKIKKIKGWQVELKLGLAKIELGHGEVMFVCIFVWIYKVTEHYTHEDGRECSIVVGLTWRYFGRESNFISTTI